MRVVDADNIVWLKTVLAQHGWPGHTLVGEEAADAAWLMIQHADRDLPFQLHAFQLLTAAVEAGEALPRHLAYLTDRCQVAQRQEQTYGTQYFEEDGRFGPCPVADTDRLDERRASAGLGPLVEYDAVSHPRRDRWRDSRRGSMFSSPAWSGPGPGLPRIPGRPCPRASQAVAP
ncbi:DUF6624 domain-containing protein [Streptomyces olivoreticuli]|uniref:DUF6624 domain-containing protein n=1 Tax=Streptomyces olivoreticuli TaxID=68246 RepID=UPI001968415F|nr:DUF6624 domain-containing protein [Streptomyces olivoreticuli]